MIARLPEPTSALRSRLYTSEFFGELRRAMKPRSVLCMTAAATPTSLPAAAGEYLGSIRATLGQHFGELVIGWGNPAQVLAGTEPGLVAVDPAVLAERYSSRGVVAELFDALWFEGATDWLEPSKLRQRAEELDAAPAVQISTDLRPVVYLQRLVLWERMTAQTGSAGGGVVEHLRAVGWGELLLGLAAVCVVAGALHYVWTRARRRAGMKPQMDTDEHSGVDVGSADQTYRAPGQGVPWAWSGAIVWSVATSGFATMALSIIWLFAFQNLYGYVYQRIGWIIAVFMAGLVVGCLWVDRRSRRRAEMKPQINTDEHGGVGVGSAAPTYAITGYLWRRLVAVDLLMALLALVIPVMLPVLGALQSGPLAFVLVEWAVSVMVALTGVLGGAAFALAGGLQLAAEGQPGAAAGSVVGADHAGACLGALLTGILLVPVFGTAACAVLLAGIKLSSVGLLLAGRRVSANQLFAEPRSAGRGTHSM